MERTATQLRQARAHAFRKEITPYVQTMFQSGFPGFLLLAFIVGMIGYGGLLRNIPPDLPVVELGAVLLSPLVAWSPLRTWLQPADVLFLMPRERQMGSYLRQAWVRNAAMGVLLLTALWGLYALLYVRAVENSHHSLLLLFFLVVCKLLNGLGAWRERQMAWSAPRQWLRLLRYACTALFVYLMLSAALWQAVAVLALAAALVALLSVRTALHVVPWEQLIAEEARTRERFLRFFNAFTDVPSASPRMARRSWLSPLAARIRFAPSNAYRYLYAQTFARTELGGIWTRLVLLGMLVAFVLAEAKVLEGYGAGFAAFVFLWLIRTQLDALRYMHKHSVWTHIYPLPEQLEPEAITVIAARATQAAAVLLWLPMGLYQLLHQQSSPALLAALVLTVYAVWLVPRSVQRRLRQEEQEV